MATDAPGILIVDDNEDNRYTLQLLLETDGHERIATAAGGNEAIALIEKEKFSLVLLDLMMPDMNGDEVLRLRYRPTNVTGGEYTVEPAGGGDYVVRVRREHARRVTVAGPG